jgi:hypothetical protein
VEVHFIGGDLASIDVALAQARRWLALERNDG